jgi:hypothetical protein
MKRSLTAALATVALLILTACGSSTGSTSADTDTATTVKMRIVPSVAGKSYIYAQKKLEMTGFITQLVGKDGKAWGNIVPGKDTTVLSTDPSEGSTTGSIEVKIVLDATAANQQKADAAAAAEERKAKAAAAAAEAAATAAAALALRYEFDCDNSIMDPLPPVHTLAEVWKKFDTMGGEECLVSIDGKSNFGEDDKPVLLPSEKSIVKIVASKGGDVGDPAEAFINVLELCARVPSTYETDAYNIKAKQATAAAAVAYCPNSPNIALLKEAVTAIKVSDGTHIVGKDMEPGTYQTPERAKDCYWARTQGNGDIIENDMIGFAPEGVVVTVYSGEGFESARCEVWTKIG